MTQKKYDFIIIGGGLAGMLMALALVKLDFKILLLEKEKAPNLTKKIYDGRNTALNNASVRFLKNLGIWEEALPFAQPINDIIVSDGTVRKGASSLFLHFDAKHIDETEMGFFIENPDLRQILQEKIQEYPEKIDVFYGQDLKSVQSDKQKFIVTTKDNDYEGRFLIGADGRFSWVRDEFDISISEHSYGHTAIVTTIKHELPHEGVAQEFFLPDGPFAMLPLTGNRMSLVWCEKDQRAKSMVKMPKDVFLYEVRRRFGDSLGKLELDSNIISYPLRRHHAATMVGDRMALIADAAHGIHPISGQGLNLGIRDIAVLYDLIQEQVKNGLDIASPLVLELYEKKRQFDIQALLNITHGLNKIFANDNIIVQTGRRLGLGLVNKMPKLRNFFIRHATGDMGDLPSLMR